MSNTAINNTESGKKNLKLRDILSDRKTMHNKNDLKNIMSAGMPKNKASESDMLDKWQKPWLYRRTILVGLILVALVLASYYVLGKFIFPLRIMTFVIYLVPPIVIPLSALMLFWELNIPKNINIFEILGVYLIGGFLSYLLTMGIKYANNIFINATFTSGSLGLAHKMIEPLGEEFGKLLMVFLVIMFYSTVLKKKMHGITGMLVGAALGAGFGVLEIIQEVIKTGLSGLINYSNFTNISFYTMRAMGGHIVYAALYAGAVGLICEKEGKFNLKCIFNFKVLTYFFISLLFHLTWNLIPVMNEYLMYQNNGIILGMVIVALVAFMAAHVVFQWKVLLGLALRCLEPIISGEYRRNANGISYQNQLDRFSAMDKENRAKDYFAEQFDSFMSSSPAKEEEQSGPVQNGYRVSPYAPPTVVSQAQVREDESRKMQFLIVCTDGFLKGRQWTFYEGETLTAGRDSDCQIGFGALATGVSRKHAALFGNSGLLYIKDLNSTNGTTVNGMVMAAGQTLALNDGDTFSLSNSGQIFSVRRLLYI